MPFVNLKIAGELSEEQKRELAKEFSESLEKIAGKNPKFTYVVFEEVDRENWAIGDRLLSDPKV